MVTKNGHHSIRLIVGIEFFLERRVRKRLVVELFLEGDRCIISTEYFRSETLHVGSKVLVKRGGLS
jgi:hypothetical protein